MVEQMVCANSYFFLQTSSGSTFSRYITKFREHLPATLPEALGSELVANYKEAQQSLMREDLF